LDETRKLQTEPVPPFCTFQFKVNFDRVGCEPSSVQPGVSPFITFERFFPTRFSVRSSYESVRRQRLKPLWGPHCSRKYCARWNCAGRQEAIRKFRCSETSCAFVRVITTCLLTLSGAQRSIRFGWSKVVGSGSNLVASPIAQYSFPKATHQNPYSSSQ